MNVKDKNHNFQSQLVLRSYLCGESMFLYTFYTQNQAREFYEVGAKHEGYLPRVEGVQAISSMSEL